MTVLTPIHDSLTTLLEHRRLQPVFQPIVDTRRQRLLGHEALIRGPAGHPLEFPGALFDKARQMGQLSELDLSCRHLAMQAYSQLQMSGLLFINVNPNLLLDKQHPKGCTQRMAQALGIPANKIVIELSEQYPIHDPAGLKIAVEHYRSLGFLIAIDDLGTGYSGLKLWSEVKPDYVKIDRYFIQDLDQDPIKREFVQSIVTLARGLQSQIIAEGIENQAELQQLQQMGVYLCQGYYLGRPQAMPLLQAPSTSTEPPSKLTIRHQESVATLARTGVPVDIEDTIQQVFDILLENEQLQSLPVLAKNIPVGILRRARVMELFSGSYGRALYANKSVRHAMNIPVVVDWQTSLETASGLITLDDDSDPLSHFIVTRQGSYYGLASVRGLLRNITEQRLQHARYANPLTQLPGNVPIYRAIDDALQQQNDFYVAYFDLNYFKPYNDVYGYAQGDKVIQWVARLFEEVVAGAGQFIGHVGGDDFVAVFDSHCHWRDLCELILQRFSDGIADFYLPEHRQHKGMLADARNGEQHFFPLLGLAIGVVAPDYNGCHSHHDVAALASDAKHQAKQHPHSHCLLSTQRVPR
ncbi:D-glycero-D-manno-heptose 1-phosphate guanosyltransferase [Oceanisphaera marina]|uniref:D-glycero-D-manno-heptose 1-phosphate guanosyltransferase n=1 Tax=Oceanisphaera marina TaxID=2017550 RepID=A0ABQ1IML1_9GAMM|nr:bifunctional diguanylate cyclase/phosphodiesterase [Oceanisphaera marina]GGB45877.1 D-glycero-D-manno-heptose 1-phosphate guanosyltransferase [Oceanisphaera marina]